MKTPKEISLILNKHLEKFMPILTPFGVIMGFIVPNVLIHLRPFIPILFSVMTLSGSLRLKVKDLKGAVSDPLPLLFFLLIAHIIIPLSVFFSCNIFLKNDPDTISGFVLLFSVPTAVSGFIWVSIYKGDTALSLTLIMLDTLISPLVVPGTMSILFGTDVIFDMTGIAVSLILMVVIPTVLGVAIHEASKGKIPQIVSPYLNPFAKICLVLVIAANSSVVAPQVRFDDPKVLIIAFLCVIFAIFGYVVSKIVGIIVKLGPEKRVAVFFATGLRNISAATTIAIEYLPASAALPALLGIVFQQSIAAIMGKILSPR